MNSNADVQLTPTALEEEAARLLAELTPLAQVVTQRRKRLEALRVYAIQRGRQYGDLDAYRFAETLGNRLRALFGLGVAYGMPSEATGIEADVAEWATFAR